VANFLTEDFLLSNGIAQRLYHDVAKELPIIDYHCHLPPQQIADDQQFKNLTDIWLKGDHYKWRAMRSNGVDERFCTGDASDKEKFIAFASTVPYTMGNPIYHWTHLELRRPFGITDVELNQDNAADVWDRANAKLSEKSFSACGLMKQMNVKMVGTTDDPLDDLSAHKKAADNKGLVTKVLPSWRPDRAFNIKQPDYVDYLNRLSDLTKLSINTFQDLCSALLLRMDHFSEHGCIIADHALDTVEYALASNAQLDKILQNRLNKVEISPIEAAQFKTAVLIYLGEQYYQRGWVQQYHIGALRNNNRIMLNQIGPDTGFDSINDRLVAEELSNLLNALAEKDKLPKTILYCLNPRDNEVIATMCGNFQGGGVPGKIQFGSGWWFNDQKDGMERQLKQLSQLGLLSRFVGMLTDSRSFLSYTRHEYFRRILCNMIGTWVENGEAPADIPLLSSIVADICFHNANEYFNLSLDTKSLLLD
jgi:glucuronate isomerase